MNKFDQYTQMKNIISLAPMKNQDKFSHFGNITLNFNAHDRNSFTDEDIENLLENSEMGDTIDDEISQIEHEHGEMVKEDESYHEVFEIDT